MTEPPPHIQGLLRLMQIRESVASVALSHPETCDCDVCKAASGDEEAFARCANFLLLDP